MHVGAVLAVAVVDADPARADDAQHVRPVDDRAPRVPGVALAGGREFALLVRPAAHPAREGAGELVPKLLYDANHGHTLLRDDAK